MRGVLCFLPAQAKRRPLLQCRAILSISARSPSDSSVAREMPSNFAAGELVAAGDGVCSASCMACAPSSAIACGSGLMASAPPGSRRGGAGRPGACTAAPARSASASAWRPTSAALSTRTSKCAVVEEQSSVINAAAPARCAARGCCPARVAREPGRAHRAPGCSCGRPLRREMSSSNGSTSASMSARRSCSAGTDRHDLQAGVEVFAEACPRAPSPRRSRAVAAITRTSTLLTRLLPRLELLLLQHAQQLGLQRAATCRRSRRGTACRRRPP